MPRFCGCGRKKKKKKGAKEGGDYYYPTPPPRPSDSQVLPIGYVPSLSCAGGGDLSQECLLQNDADTQSDGEILNNALDESKRTVTYLETITSKVPSEDDEDLDSQVKKELGASCLPAQVIFVCACRLLISVTATVSTCRMFSSFFYFFYKIRVNFCRVVCVLFDFDW